MQVCWLPVGCMLDFLACWFLDEQYCHWFPAGPVEISAVSACGWICWLYSLDLRGLPVLGFTGIRGSPRVLWRFQRYLPAARSAGLVTGPAGATCAGFYRDQRQPAGPVEIPAVSACGWICWLCSLDLRGQPAWGFYRDQRQPAEA